MRLFRIIIAVLLFFTAISSLFGGISLVTDPSGSSLGMHTQLLKGTLFTDFFIPGMILAVVIGGSSFLAGVSVLGVTERSPKLVIAAGIILTSYILAEFILINGHSFLQVICLGMGIIQIISGIILLSKSNTHQ